MIQRLKMQAVGTLFMVGTIGDLETEKYKGRCSKSKMPFM